MKKMKLELGTQLVKFIDVGMYQSQISPEEILNSDEYTDEYWDKFDRKKYTEFIFNCAKDIFNELYLEELKKIEELNIVSGEAVKIYSPRYYNFGADEFYFDIEIDGTIKEVWEQYEEKIDGGEFDTFLKEANKSYDGFISMMPKSIEELVKMIEEGEDDERVFASILNYELSKDEENYQKEFMEKIMDEYPLYDFEKEESLSERYVKTFESWKNNKR
jgi:hypothetical protein